MTSPIRILIADDHAMVRQGLSQICNAENDMKVVGEASDGQEAIQQTLLSQPDVVVMDINMPNLDGVQATRRLTETNPELGVIIITMNRQDEYIFEAIKAGARAYLLKNANSDELLYAIRTVAAGEALLNPVIAMKMIAEFRRLQTNFGETDSLTLLTDSELEILRLVAQGMSNKDISEKLGLAEKTVRNRLSAIFDKLHVSNRVQATLVALREGLASLDVDNG
ncbi:MAG: response regulator transcription factor [Anaerolineae bacterium]|jgi:DNA-binding NarL/FixJ family response regulator|nr:response regulator transcription factor [Anaerolineae bacterium]